MLSQLRLSTLTHGLYYLSIKIDGHKIIKHYENFIPFQLLLFDIKEVSDHFFPTRNVTAVL